MCKGAIVDVIATAPSSGPAISSPAVEDPIIDMIAVHTAELVELTATNDPREILDGVDRADMILLSAADDATSIISGGKLAAPTPCAAGLRLS
jgi:hypothetical protein